MATITKEILNRNFKALGLDRWAVPPCSFYIIAKTYGDEVEFGLYKRTKVNEEAVTVYLCDLHDTDDLRAVARLFVTINAKFDF